MKYRPPGVYVACGLLAVVGAWTAVSGAGYLDAIDAIDATTPTLVRWFLVVVPVAAVLWGLLSVAAALGLWAGEPWGRRAGLLAVGLWTAGEVLVGGMALVGVEPARGAVDLLVVVLRLAVGAGLLVYIWAWALPYVAAKPERVQARS